MLAEQHHEWAVGRRYMTMATLLPTHDPELTTKEEVAGLGDLGPSVPGEHYGGYKGVAGEADTLLRRGTFPEFEESLRRWA